MNSSTKLLLVTAVALAALTACGGGGSGGDATQPPPPAVASDYLPLVTAVPTPTYAAASRELAEFIDLNALRGKCGFGLLAQDKSLDLMAHDHQAYLSTVVTGQVTYGSKLLEAGLSLHEEYAALFPNGFTGANHLDRAKFRNYQGGNVSETITAGVGQVQSLMVAPYHAAALLSGWTDVGISIAADNASKWGVFNFGYKSKRQMFDADVLTYPCAGVTGTAVWLQNESPSPYAPRDLAKNPIGQSVYFVGNGDGQIEVTNISMTEAISGAPVAMLPVQSRLNDQKLSPYFAFASPDGRLRYSTLYRVKATVKSNGKTVPIDYTFTTMVSP